MVKTTDVGRARFFLTLFLSSSVLICVHPWLIAAEPAFQLKPGEFPPPGSAHSYAGELIAVDHVNRTGQLRPDRDDTQKRGDWDVPRPFVMLPFGSIWYRGAPASLKDVPLGTHLHGEFYADEPPPAPPLKKGQKPPPVVDTFTRAVRLEDDFSRSMRLARRWKVEAVDAAAGTLRVVGLDRDDKPDAKPTTFQVFPSTRVWKGRGVGTLADVTAGQAVVVNLTHCTLKGPGRVTDVWVDREAREVAYAHQLEVHRQYTKEHGLPGWVTAVDNKTRVVTVVLFDGFDEKLLDKFRVGEPVAAAVAEPTLRTYDQVNDVKRGPITAVAEAQDGLGCGGVRVSFQPSELLEGFRPGRVVRLFAAAWKLDDVPREEKLYP